MKLQRLSELGHELRRPEADFLRDKIYELRIGRQGINYRILYFLHQGQADVLTHGLMKEKAVPQKAIDEAIKHKQKFESNPEQYTYQEEKE